MNRSNSVLALLGALTLVVACTSDEPFDPDDFEPSVPVATQLAKAGGDGPPQFLSTHPAPENRQQTLSALVPQMMPYYQAPGTRPTVHRKRRLLKVR